MEVDGALLEENSRFGTDSHQSAKETGRGVARH